MNEVTEEVVQSSDEDEGYAASMMSGVHIVRGSIYVDAVVYPILIKLVPVIIFCLRVYISLSWYSVY